MSEARDPFEVLGVSMRVDKKSLKRAYGRLIRQHRPDKDPEGFQRVHAAYETVLALRQADDWQDAEESREFESPTPPPALPQPLDVELPEEDPRREAEEWDDEPPSAESDEDDEWVSTVRGDGDALTGDLDLARLVAEYGAEDAVALLNDAVERLVLEGHVNHLAEQLLSDAAHDLMVAHRELEFAILFVAAALAYDAPEKTGALLDLVDLKSERYRWLEDRVHLSLTYAKDFAQKGGRELPPAWARLIRYLPIVDRKSELPLLDEALALIRANPQLYIDKVKPLPEGIVKLIGETALPPEVTVDDAEEPHAEALDDLLARVEKELDGDTTNSLWTWVIVAAFFADVYVWMTFGWVFGLIGLALAIAIIAVPQNGIDSKLYVRYVQTPILDYILQTGVSPAHVIAAMTRRKVTTDVRRFHHEVGEDPLLPLAHQLVAGVRLRRSGEL